jgi:hypothetical protein
MNDLLNKRFDIVFTKSADYRIVAATGAWGGPTPQGEILCSFFVEYASEPKSLKIEIGPNGQTKELEKGTQKTRYIREQQIGVVLRPDIAKSVGQWLIEHADNIMEPKPTFSS